MRKIKLFSLVLALCLLCAACQSDEPSGVGNHSIALPGERTEEEGQEAELPPLPLAEGVNPLTGLAALEGAEAGQRPVAVMVANAQNSWPQRGLAAADVLLEAPAEGGITRLMAMYGDYRAVPQVGPVRSTRDQFVQFAVPSNAVLTHIGSSVYAENLLNVLSYQDVDGIYLGTTSFYFDVQRSQQAGGEKLNENCWFTDAGLIVAGMQAVSLPHLGEVHTLFRFGDDGPEAGTDAYDIMFQYSDISPLTFHYNEEVQNYTKTAFGLPHTDEDGTPYYFNNVIVLVCEVSTKEDGVVPEFDLSGGHGYYFAKGAINQIYWEKGGPTQPLRLLNKDGTELEVQPGKSYIGLLPQEQEKSIVCTTFEEREQLRQEIEAEAAASASQEALASEPAPAPAEESASPPAEEPAQEEPAPET